MRAEWAIARGMGTRRTAVGACCLWDREAVERSLPPLKGEIPREGTHRAAVGVRYLWDREAVERSYQAALPPWPLKIRHTAKIVLDKARGI